MHLAARRTSILRNLSCFAGFGSPFFTYNIFYEKNLNGIFCIPDGPETGVLAAAAVQGWFL
jgi:hypothetical protein